MPALARLLTDADIRRLAGWLDARRETDRLMRRPGGLPTLPPPAPLHRQHPDNGKDAMR